jgi:hypothetical protein
MTWQLPQYRITWEKFKFILLNIDLIWRFVMTLMFMLIHTIAVPEDILNIVFMRISQWTSWTTQTPLRQVNELWYAFNWTCFVWLFKSQSRRGVQHYVIKFVSDLWQVGGFLWVLRFPPPIKLTATIGQDDPSLSMFLINSL